jgi:hypothetical protein
MTARSGQASGGETEGFERHGASLLLFLHIPKASGTTLSSILERQYPAHAIYRTADMAPRAIAEALGRGRAPEDLQCVMGHMYFGLHRHLTRPATYITMLRHPMPRLISHYAYVRRMREHPLHAAVNDGRMTFEEYVASGVSSDVNDGQVRFLCGRDDAGTVGFGRVSEDMLADAMANLQSHFTAVGITERFDESLLLFQRLLGWRSVEYLPQNKSARDEVSLAISEATRTLVERYNRLDLELYDYARRMVAGAVATHGIDTRAVSLFRARNIRYRVLRRARKLVARRLRPLTQWTA